MRAFNHHTTGLLPLSPLGTTPRSPKQLLSISIVFFIGALLVYGAVFNGVTEGLRLSIAIAVSVYFIAGNGGPKSDSIHPMPSSSAKKPHSVPLKEVQLFRSAFENATAMALATVDGQWLNINRSFSETLGFAQTELSGLSFRDLVHPEEVEIVDSQIESLLEGKSATCHAEQRFMHKEGFPLWVSLTVTFIRNVGGEQGYLIFQLQNITEQKRTEEKLLRTALHDPLTDLPNRALFLDHLKLAVERSRRRQKRSFAVLFLDLDGFKAINDKM